MKNVRPRKFSKSILKIFSKIFLQSNFEISITRSSKKSAPDLKFIQLFSETFSICKPLSCQKIDCFILAICISIFDRLHKILTSTHSPMKLRWPQTTLLFLNTFKLECILTFMVSHISYLYGSQFHLCELFCEINNTFAHHRNIFLARMITYSRDIRAQKS